MCYRRSNNTLDIQLLYAFINHLKLGIFNIEKQRRCTSIKGLYPMDLLFLEILKKSSTITKIHDKSNS